MSDKHVSPLKDFFEMQRRLDIFRNAGIYVDKTTFPEAVKILKEKGLIK